MSWLARSVWLTALKKKIALAIIAQNTAKLPRSFARFPAGEISGLTRSIMTSMAVLSASRAIKIKNNMVIMPRLTTGDLSRISATIIQKYA